MKKILLLFVLGMSFSLIGCGDNQDNSLEESSSYSNSSSDYSSDDYSSSDYSSSDYSSSDYSSNSAYDYNDYDDYGEGYGYDPNDQYYSSNDHNNDGKISDSEFQDAMNDYLDDIMGY